MTGSRRSAAWTSSLEPRLRPTRRRARFFACSVCRSPAKPAIRSRRPEAGIGKNLSHGETEFDQQERAEQETGHEVCEQIHKEEGRCQGRSTGKARMDDRTSKAGGAYAQR